MAQRHRQGALRDTVLAVDAAERLRLDAELLHGVSRLRRLIAAWDAGQAHAAGAVLAANRP